MNKSERKKKKIVFIAKDLLTLDFRITHSYLYLLMNQNFVAKKQKNKVTNRKQILKWPHGEYTLLNR